MKFIDRAIAIFAFVIAFVLIVLLMSNRADRCYDPTRDDLAWRDYCQAK